MDYIGRILQNKSEPQSDKAGYFYSNQERGYVSFRGDFEIDTFKREIHAIRFAQNKPI
jgi:hypothetical protein